MPKQLDKITVGFDTSLTHTGYAIMQGNKVLNSGVIKSKPLGNTPLDEIKRIDKIATESINKIDTTLPLNMPPDLVTIEGLAFMAQGTSLVQLAALNYMIRLLLMKRNIPFIIIAPTTVKKFITGSGKGDKDMMMMQVYKNYGFEALDNNENDAFSLSVIGQAILGNLIKKVNKPQEEVLLLLKKQL